MKNNMVRAGKSATIQKRKRPSAVQTADVESKVKQSFARQVEAFIKRYRPALEALAKR